MKTRPESCSLWDLIVSLTWVELGLASCQSLESIDMLKDKAS